MSTVAPPSSGAALPMGKDRRPPPKTDEDEIACQSLFSSCHNIMLNIYNNYFFCV